MYQSTICGWLGGVGSLPVEAASSLAWSNGRSAKPNEHHDPAASTPTVAFALTPRHPVAGRGGGQSTVEGGQGRKRSSVGSAPLATA
jgi:hypothetical protein